MLNDRFGLQVINDVGGIPPGKWYCHIYDNLIRCMYYFCLSILSLSLPLSISHSLSFPLYLSYSFTPTIANINLIGDLFTDAIVIAIVSFALNIAQAKLLAIKNGYSIHPDQVQQ